MPIYEYQCQDCGHRLEALQKISDAPLKECPQCHKLALAKLVSASSFRLKGGGWYETDFKTGAKRHGTQDSAGESSSSASKSTDKTASSQAAGSTGA
ncbi:MAG: zinc ribbon domain-containing protein [Pseudomonadales bacterium]|nr:zinc ribbon domain-containing protein [Pseudomonadales bacterium]MCP5357516.1 zinc ribbon domain-containing protein [Pseudomonadales bacterium]